MTKVHPAPLEHWPEHVKRIYITQCHHIDKCLEYVDEDGVVQIPFFCYLCGKMKDDYSFSTGDGCPICEACFSIKGLL